MSFVFADYQSKNIIDILEDRRLHSLTEYFSKFSLEANFNIYQDIIHSIKHNNFKKFESVVKKYLSTKEKISKKMIISTKNSKKTYEILY